MDLSIIITFRRGGKDMPEDKFIGSGNESGDSGVKLSIAGRTINVSKELVEYNNFRKRFSNKAESLKNEHVNFYNSRVHTFDGLFEIEIPEVLNKAYSAIKFGNSVLMEYGVDYISEEELVGRATANGGIKEKLRPIFEEVEEIERYAESLGDYRNVQRAGRGYWRGGGFGLSGAIKGVLTAEALNLGTGVFRSIGDSITNRRDKAEIDKMKNSLATSEMAELYLTNAVYQFCMDVFTCVEKILVSEGKINPVNFNIKRAKSRAKNYISRYQEQKSVSCYNEAVDVLCECIQDFPYSSDFYSGLYQILKGDKNEVHSAVRYFGVEYYYKAVIVYRDTELMDRLVEKAGRSTPAGIVDIENQIRSIARNNPYISAYKYLKLLEEKAPSLTNSEGIKAAREAHKEFQKSIYDERINAARETHKEIQKNIYEENEEDIQEAAYNGDLMSMYLEDDEYSSSWASGINETQSEQENMPAISRSAEQKVPSTVPRIGTASGEPKPVEPKPVELKPVKSESMEPKPVEPKPVEPKATEPKSIELKPIESKPMEPKPVEPKPVESKSMEPKPVELKPVKSKSMEPKPVEPKPVEPKPMGPKPMELKPKPMGPTKPVEAKRVEQTTNSAITKEQAELLKRLEEISASVSAQKKGKNAEPPYSGGKKPPTNYNTKSSSNSAVKRKSKIIAGWLAIFLGAYGIHWFYLDRPLRGVIYFALCMGLFMASLNQYFFAFCIIEGIYILCMSDKKFERISQKKGSRERR